MMRQLQSEEDREGSEERKNQAKNGGVLGKRATEYIGWGRRKKGPSHQKLLLRQFRGGFGGDEIASSNSRKKGLSLGKKKLEVSKIEAAG